MKINSDDCASYIPLWIYEKKQSISLNTELPFTELGNLFFNELSVKIKHFCICSVNASSWNDFLAKDAVTTYNVLSFVLKYLWDCENIRMPFMHKCDLGKLVANGQVLQQAHQKLADETIDLKHKWLNTYIADMYSEYVNYIIDQRYNPDKTDCRLGTF